MEKTAKIFIAIGCVALVVAGGITFYKIKNPVVSGIEAGAESFEYKGVKAVKYDYFTDFNEFEYIGKTQDGDYKVYISGDKDKPNLFTLEGEKETYSYKSDDYEIASSGKATKVFTEGAVRGRNENTTTDKADLEMFDKLITDTGNITHTFHIDDIAKYGKKFYFAYENCPVSQGDNLGGYVAYNSQDGWIYVSAEYYNEGEFTTEGDVTSADLTGWKIAYSDLDNWLEGNPCGIKPKSFR